MNTTMAKTIKRFNELLQQTEYLYRTRPTRWIDDKSLCLKMDDKKAAMESEWLNFIGQPHEIIEVEGNH